MSKKQMEILIETIAGKTELLHSWLEHPDKCVGEEAYLKSLGDRIKALEKRVDKLSKSK
jgi:hypothetical protein